MERTTIPKTRNIGIRVTESFLAMIRREARHRNMGITAFIEMCVQDFILNHGRAAKGKK